MLLKSLNFDVPQIMAVLNVTPDSFSDGGEFFNRGALDVSKVKYQVAKLIDSGAAIIDVGGESTRPGALDISEQEELDRVMPVVELISKEFNCVISLDSSKANVMCEGAKQGVGLLNDVRSFTEADALSVAIKTGLPMCFMHMKGTPKTMQDAPEYEDVVAEVTTYLSGRLDEAINQGADRSNLWVDPGFGFGKTLKHNLQLLASLNRLNALGRLLIGVSRKRMIGEMTGRSVHERATGSAIVAYHAMQLGAKIIRVHDVDETSDALNIFKAIQKFGD